MGRRGRVALPGVAAVILLAGVLPGRSPGRSGQSTEDLMNRRLALRIQLSGDLSRYRVRADFSYEVRGPVGDGVYFTFPGVDDPSTLELGLDGAPVGTSGLTRTPHPRYSGEVFRLRQGSGPEQEGRHLLSVTGPWQENEKPFFARWGGWHAFLGDRGSPVPIELEVVTSPNLTVVASGRHTGEEVENGVRTSRWRTRNPQGWVFLAVGEYAEHTLKDRETPLKLWLPDGLREPDHRALSREPSRVLRFLETRLSPARLDTARMLFLPVEGLTNFSVDGLLVGSRATAARMSSGPEYVRGFLAHEMAHYWFGDLVQAHGRGARWLTEGFAEYWRYRYEESVGGEPVPWSFRNQVVLRRFAGRPMPTLEDEVGGDDEVLYYQKGAFVLFMLERRLGREAMDRVMRRYVHRFSGRSVLPGHFFTVAEELTGHELGWFRRQWLDRPRGPVLSRPDARAEPRGTGFVLEVGVRQEEPPYRLDLPIAIVTEDGQEHRYVRPVWGERHTFSFELESRPERVTLDPDGRIFKWFPTELLPADFAAFRQRILEGEGYRVEGGGGEGWGEIRRWISDQLGPPASGEGARHLLHLGDSAGRIRMSVAPSLPPPPEGTVQAFVRRDPCSAERLIVGIEGQVPATLPPVIPDAPLSYVVFRDGSVVGAHATALPSLSREVPDADSPAVRPDTTARAGSAHVHRTGTRQAGLRRRVRL